MQLMPIVSTADHSLLSLTGGQSQFEVQASSVRAAVHEIDHRHPGVLAHVEAGMAIAIDGVIHQDGWLEPLAPSSEVVLIPRIAGG